VTAVAALIASLALISPHQAVAYAKRDWLKEVRAAATTGDRSTRFPSPPRAVLVRRLDAAAARFGFRVVSVEMVRLLQRAPVVVISSDRKLALARATPAIMKTIDPRRVTKQNPSGFAYEGIFFVAQSSRGMPYLAVFNFWRAPHVGGGQWAASEGLFPYSHG